MVDHTAEAVRLIARATDLYDAKPANGNRVMDQSERERNHERAAHYIAEAQVHATLAVAQQVRG